jgi:hypothetical protein
MRGLIPEMMPCRSWQRERNGSLICTKLLLKQGQ